MSTIQGFPSLLNKLFNKDVLVTTTDGKEEKGKLVAVDQTLSPMFIELQVPAVLSTQGVEQYASLMISLAQVKSIEEQVEV